MLLCRPQTFGLASSIAAGRSRYVALIANDHSDHD